MKSKHRSKISSENMEMCLNGEMHIKRIDSTKRSKSSSEGRAALGKHVAVARAVASFCDVSCCYLQGRKMLAALPGRRRVTVEQSARYLTQPCITWQRGQDPEVAAPGVQGPPGADIALRSHARGSCWEERRGSGLDWI